MWIFGAKWILVALVLVNGIPTSGTAEFNNLESCQKAAAWLHSAADKGKFSIASKCINKNTGEVWPEE